MNQHPGRRVAIVNVVTRAVAVAVVTLGALAVGAILGACAAPASTASASSPGAQPVTAGQTVGAVSAGATVNDWTHALQVIASLKAAPPTQPVVLLVGGSSARECSVSDATWAQQVRTDGIANVKTFDLGSHNRTTAQDLALMQALPADSLRGIAYIAMNVERFTSAAKTAATISLPTSGSPSPWAQHIYDSKRMLSVSAKKVALRRWLVKRYPLFKRNYTVATKLLGQLIAACQKAGLQPVLIEMPRNMAIIGHTLDQPIARYKATCAALSKTYHLPPFVSFVKTANLKNGDFYDLWHLEKSGRAKWQALLSKTTVSLMKKYKLGGSSS